MDDLSEPAQSIAYHTVEEAFEAGRNVRDMAILGQIRATTGEAVADSSFNRWRRWWEGKLRIGREARRKTDAAAKMAAERGLVMTDAVRAELLLAFNEMAQAKELPKMGGFYLGLLAHKFVEADQKSRELRLREEKHELDREKFAAVEKKLQAVEEKAAAVKDIIERSSELSEETKRSIRQEIYGLE